MVLFKSIFLKILRLTCVHIVPVFTIIKMIYEGRKQKITDLGVMTIVDAGNFRLK